MYFINLSRFEKYNPIDSVKIFNGEFFFLDILPPHPIPLPLGEGVILNLSALTGEGVNELKQTLTSKVCDIEPENLEFVTNSRQQTCLARARTSLDQALLAANIRELQDLISIDVKASLLALDELTGELITDDILDNIFDHFCIGK